MKDIVLCNYFSEKIDIHVRAYIQNKKLKIEGQDLGDNVIDFWGEDEYEYFYTFSPQETKKLKMHLQKELNKKSGLLKLLSVSFSGVEGCSNLKSFCEKHNIQYEYFSC